MYLDMAALNSLPVNLVPLTTSVKVLFFHFLLHRSSLPSSVMQWMVLNTKAGPPAAAKDTGPSYRHQNQVTQTGKVQFALGRHQRVGAGVAVAVVVPHTEQPIIGALA